MLTLMQTMEQEGDGVDLDEASLGDIDFAGVWFNVLVRFMCDNA